MALFGKLSVTPSLVLRSTPENLTNLYVNTGVSLDQPYEINLNALLTPIDPLDIFVTVRNVNFRRYALRGVSGPAVQEPRWVMAGLHFRY